MSKAALVISQYPAGFEENLGGFDKTILKTYKAMLKKASRNPKYAEFSKNTVYKMIYKNLGTIPKELLPEVSKAYISSFQATAETGAPAIIYNASRTLDQRLKLLESSDLTRKDFIKCYEAYAAADKLGVIHLTDLAQELMDRT